MISLFLLAITVSVPAGNDTTETLLRAAAYDRNLDARTPEGFRLGVTFDADVPASQAEAQRFAAEANALKVTGSELAPVWVELVAVEDAAQLYRWIRTEHVFAIYMPGGMENDVPTIIAASAAAGVFTLAGAPADVERGLVLGLRVADEAKKLVVNMAAAKRAGVDFDAVVRRIAQRVGDAPAKEGRDELQQTLVRYTEAIQGGDLVALRGVWPALERDDEKRLVASFKMARSHSVHFAVLRIDHEGERARARVRRADKLVTRDGQVVAAGSLVDITFSKVGDGDWRIDSMAKATAVS